MFDFDELDNTEDAAAVGVALGSQPTGAASLAAAIGQRLDAPLRKSPSATHCNLAEAAPLGSPQKQVHCWQQGQEEERSFADNQREACQAMDEQVRWQVPSVLSPGGAAATGPWQRTAVACRQVLGSHDDEKVPQRLAQLQLEACAHKSAPSRGVAAKALEGSVLAVPGHLYETVGKVMMRRAEELSSQSMGHLGPATCVKVLEVGQGRRVRVRTENGEEGWVSVVKESGEQLLRAYVSVGEEGEALGAEKKVMGKDAADLPPAAKCDKCDGPHLTERCPFFKKEREDHKDAWANYGQEKAVKMGSDGGDFVMPAAHIVRQPGDGSCLFHSLSFGLAGGRSDPGAAEDLRRELAAFIAEHPKLEIAGDTIEEWVRWDQDTSVTEYAGQMARRGWGGGIEMACCSILKGVNVHVYENFPKGGFKRISCFNVPAAKQTIHVLYQGRAHYDALVPT